MEWKRWTAVLTLFAAGCAANGTATTGGEASDTATDEAGDGDGDGDGDDDGESSASSSASMGDGDGDGDGDGTADLPPCEAVPTERGVLEREDPRFGEPLAACALDQWFFAAAVDSGVRIEIDADVPIEARVRWPDGGTPDDIHAELVNGITEGVLEFQSPRSGEFMLEVRAIDPEDEGEYDVAYSCTEFCSRETTRFPIVLVHGWTGFENIGPIEYFFGVVDAITALPMQYPNTIAVLDPYNSVEVRSEQLASVVDAALVEHRARKVNLVAHSQGGLDSRRLISTLGYGDRVSSLTTIATPHRGTPLTDVALGVLPGDTDAALFFLLELVGASGGNQSDAEASFATMTEDFVQNEFNPANPDDPNVTYISYAGETCLSLLSCDDVVDLPISAGYGILIAISGANDGVVPVASSIWGDYRGVLPADHFDEVGQVAGSTGPNFDHIEFYRQVVRDLRDEGH